MTTIELTAAHQVLRKTVGTYAYRALLSGRPLQVWRNSTPHNRWIATKRGPHEHLWHSGDGPNVDMRLFRLKRHGRACVIQYWGGDSGMPRHSFYLLRKRGAIHA